MIKLFEIGENNMVSLNKVWISTVPAFRALLARDKGGPGDGSGKYKKKATREFTYIYHLVDFHSPLEEYPKAERIQMALDWAGLNDKYSELEADKEFQHALWTYESMLANSSKSLQQLRAMKKAVDAMNLFLEEVNFTSVDNNGKMVYDIKKVNDVIIAMPKIQAALEEMEFKVKTEMLDNVEMRGGAEKGVEEDPEDDE